VRMLLLTLCRLLLVHSFITVNKSKAWVSGYTFFLESWQLSTSSL